MRYLKLYEHFSQKDKINEEWYPRGPYMGLKGHGKETVVEFFNAKNNKLGIQFIKGEGNHLKQIKEIIDIMKSDKNVENNFDCFDVMDGMVKYLVIGKNNLENNYNKAVKYFKTLGDVSENNNSIEVILNDEIEIFTEEGDKKNDRIFNEKLDKLYYNLENKKLPRTEETDKLIDELLTKFIDIDID